MPKLDLFAVPSFYRGYIKLVQEDDVLSAMAENTSECFHFLYDIQDDRWNYRYALNKWSIKEMVQHMIDAERIFSYRALRFARNDSTPLPGFDENTFASASMADRRSKADLIQEFEIVGKSTELLFKSFDENQLQATGIANQNTISVNAIGFIVAGHVKHHINVIKERYLK